MSTNAIDNSNLKSSPHLQGAIPSSFIPKITVECDFFPVDPELPIEPGNQYLGLKITEQSTFPAGDSLKVAHVNISGQNAASEAISFSAPGDEVIDIDAFGNELFLSATVVSDGGLVANAALAISEIPPLPGLKAKFSGWAINQGL